MMRSGMLNAKYYLLNAVWNFGSWGVKANIMIFGPLFEMKRGGMFNASPASFLNKYAGRV